MRLPEDPATGSRGSAMKVSIFLEHLVELAAQKRCSLAAALKEANRAGVGYVEIDYARTKGREADMVRLLNGTGLQPGGLYGFFDCAHQDESEALDAFVECAARLGVVNIMAMPGRMDEGDDMAAVRARIGENLTHLTGQALKQGITVVLEDYDAPNSTYGTAEELMWYLDHVPGLYCTLDTGNFLFHGKDVLKAYDLLESRIRHVHMKDLAFAPLRGEAPSLAEDGKKLYPAPVGSGELPMAEIVRRLYERGYNGLYAIEHFGAKDQNLFMRRSARWLNNIFR